jgi:hypothetical protein
MTSNQQTLPQGGGKGGVKGGLKSYPLHGSPLNFFLKGYSPENFKHIFPLEKVW